MNKNKLAALLAALGFMVVILIVHLWHESQPRDPDRVPSFDQEASVSAAGNSRRSPDPASYGAQAPAPPSPQPQISPGDISAVVHLRADGFQPVNFDIRATSFPLNLALTQSRPESIHTAPQLKGRQPWFGVLHLGRPIRDYPFILDLTADERFEMWFDANANGDLTVGLAALPPCCACRGPRSHRSPDTPANLKSGFSATRPDGRKASAPRTTAEPSFGAKQR